MKKFLAWMAVAGMLLMNFTNTPVIAAEENGGETTHAKAAYVATEQAPAVDGFIEAVWETTEAVWSDAFYVEGSGQAHGYSKILWTEDALYFLSVIDDATMQGIGDDSTTNIINLWVSETASAENAYGVVAGDYHYASNAAGNTYHYCGNDMSQIAECKAVATETGYIVEVKVPVQTPDYTFTEGSLMGFNLSVDDDFDGDNQRDACSTWQNYETTGAYWAEPSCLNKVELVKYELPQGQAAYATTAPVIDGEWEEVWDTTEGFWANLWYVPGSPMAYGYAKVLWTENTLYMLAVIEDATLDGIPEFSTTNLANFWVSETASTEEAYGNVPGDYHYAVNQAGGTSYYTGIDMKGKAQHAVKMYDGMYIVEVAVPVQTEGYSFAENALVGFNISIDDDMDGDDVRDFCCSWQLTDYGRSYWVGGNVLNKLELVKTVENPLVTGNPADKIATEPTEAPEDAEPTAAPTEAPATEEPTTETESNNVVVYVVIAVVVLAVIVAGVFVARKKK